MRRTSQIVRIGKRKIELSNLDKVLYPDEFILKAELIDYYLKIAPAMLAHLKGRPLSLVRYPDGINGERFFQKNRPEWSPEWIEHAVIAGAGKEEAIDYVMANGDASLVWLANLACIELHQMHCRSPHLDNPDYFVFDLDPPEDYNFGDVIRIASDLKELIENFGYRPFVKTTGRKGLHILVPIEPKWPFDMVFEAAREIGEKFVAAYSRTTTLHIIKEARKGKVLVDIYRNRPGQTIVAAYSVRGVAGAPVSMPLQWDQLKNIESPAGFDLHSVPGHVMSNGDAWEGIEAYAGGLHTVRKKIAVKPERISGLKRDAVGILREYAGKRIFAKTAEPRPGIAAGTGNSFVVHRHHARQLHYDLRLEQGGVLKSWAVPKGLPPRPGIIRLAVATEDHPLDYAKFEGSIPKGQYGGGEMWIFAGGRYEITSQKKKGFHFRLQSREISAEYLMHHSGERNWMIERADRPQIDWLKDPVMPMLAQSGNIPNRNEQYLFEVKWDGIRAMVAVDEGEVRIRNRNQRDISAMFPELLSPDKAFRTTSALFDTEIVCLDHSGKPVFTDVIHRLRQTGKDAIGRAMAKCPAICYVFDCLYLDGRQITNEPLVRRRAWMEDSLRAGTPYRVSEIFEEGGSLFKAVTDMGLEGIMAKEKESTYQPGNRSARWTKVKKHLTMECMIVGYTRGTHGREAFFGALQMAVKQGDELRYVGKVGTGFDDNTMTEVFMQLKNLRRIKRPVRQRPPDEAGTVWIEPKLICEVRYSSLTKDGILREPVFLRLRSDLL